jgi:hypothetical protein
VTTREYVIQRAFVIIHPGEASRDDWEFILRVETELERAA